MSRRHFGTDGVRGVANKELTPELAFQLGQAAGRWLLGHGTAKSVVMGADTRISGPMLGAGMAAGFCSVGVSVTDVGVAPTPTVSYLARTGEFGLGAIVSASHNPAPDNGIKFVGHDGRKLPDASEVEIEGLMEVDKSTSRQVVKSDGQVVDPDSAVSLVDLSTRRLDDFPRPTGADVGRIRRDTSGLEAYLGFLQQILPEGLYGWHVAMDCSNGAAFALGPEILRRLGAQVTVIGAEPDGVNINAVGGATKPDTICGFTVESGAQIGVAFDGDADRAVFSDEKGRLINGDRTIGIWSQFHHAPIAVGTVMSNGGFEAYLRSNGVKLERAPVGDKYVAQRIEETGARVGGEQSGHIIFPERGPTGDGLATMLELFRVLRLEGKRASEYYDAYEPWPQLLVNVGVSSKDGWTEKVAGELSEGERLLEGRGRLVVRPSGTQPMIRVMVEADEYALRDKVADMVVDAMLERLGGHVHGRVDLTYALGD